MAAPPDTNFERVRRSTSGQRDTAEDDAYLARMLAAGVGVGSTALAVFALLKLKHPTLRPAVALAACCAIFASRELATVSRNVEILAATDDLRALASPIDLSDAVFRGTWVSKRLLSVLLIRWLNKS